MRTILSCGTKSMELSADQGESTYKWDASDYAGHSSAQQVWAREIIGRLGLSGEELVLDIGCGDGKVTAEIASHLTAGHVTGIDNSDDMINLAIQKFPPEKYPNLIFLKQDARAMSFDREFDVIFSNAALHWVLNHKPVLKGMYKALRPDGRVIVQMGGKGNASRIMEAAGKVMEKEEWRPYFDNFEFPYGFYSPDEYEPWLKEAGFKIHKLTLEPKIMVHENAGKFKGWFRTTWLPYLYRIPMGLREKFTEAVTQQYLAVNPMDHEGKITTKMQRLEYWATK